jgi:hypothetical protein
MSYYYKWSEKVDYTYEPERGEKVDYVVKMYEGPFRTERECVEHAVDSKLKDFEVIELP